MMIKIADAHEVLRLNKYLTDIRNTLRQLGEGSPKAGSITVHIGSQKANRWGETDSYKIESEALGVIAMGYVRGHYEKQEAATIRKLNALGGEIGS